MSLTSSLTTSSSMTLAWKSLLSAEFSAFPRVSRTNSLSPTAWSEQVIDGFTYQPSPLNSGCHGGESSNTVPIITDFRAVISMSDKKEDKIRLVKITNGTVIDHIRAGMALDVLQILGITGKEGYVLSLTMNIHSNRIGSKDIIKLEDRFLEESEVAKIALVAPEATINLIQDERVVKKTRIVLPDVITSILRCPNTRCVTNKEREPIVPRYEVMSRSPLKLRCSYCWTNIDQQEIVQQFTEKRRAV